MDTCSVELTDGSDDLVDIEVFEPAEVKEVETNEVWSVVPGVYEGCIIEKVPYKFVKVKNKFEVEYKTVSVPVKVSIKGEANCLKIYNECVVVV